MAIDYLVPITQCPECGIVLDCSTNVDNGRKPGPGDFSVCIICMTVLRYTEDMQVRIPTLAECSEAGPDLERMVRGLQLAQLSRPDLAWSKRRKK